MRGLTDEEVSARAHDNSLSGEERRRYQTEEKIRDLRNKQKRQNKYHAEDDFWGDVAKGAVTIIGVAGAIIYFCYTGSPEMIYQFVY